MQEGKFFSVFSKWSKGGRIEERADILGIHINKIRSIDNLQ